jgi:hypothetical protein
MSDSEPSYTEPSSHVVGHYADNAALRGPQVVRYQKSPDSLVVTSRTST